MLGQLWPSVNKMFTQRFRLYSELCPQFSVIILFMASQHSPYYGTLYAQ